MARARNLKPGFFLNQELAQCAHGARLLFQGLWCLADREGRLKDNPEWIKVQIFPFERAPVEKWLAMLAEHGFILRYENSNRRFIQVVNFLKHQTPHIKEAESLIPAPDSASVLSKSEPVPSTYIGMGNQQSGISNPESGRARSGHFEPPTVEAVAAYCTERKNTIDPQAFVDFYKSKGWKVGKSPMVDWQASVRTWEKNENGKPNARTAGATHVGPGQRYRPPADQ